MTRRKRASRHINSAGSDGRSSLGKLRGCDVDFLDVQVQIGKLDVALLPCVDEMFLEYKSTSRRVHLMTTMQYMMRYHERRGEYSLTRDVRILIDVDRLASISERQSLSLEIYVVFAVILLTERFETICIGLIPFDGLSSETQRKSYLCCRDPFDAWIAFRSVLNSFGYRARVKRRILTEGVLVSRDGVSRCPMVCI